MAANVDTQNMFSQLANDLEDGDVIETDDCEGFCTVDRYGKRKRGPSDANLPDETNNTIMKYMESKIIGTRFQKLL
jgi:hypothetical protein